MKKTIFEEEKAMSNIRIATLKLIIESTEKVMIRLDKINCIIILNINLKRWNQVYVGFKN